MKRGAKEKLTGEQKHDIIDAFLSGVKQNVLSKQYKVSHALICVTVNKGLLDNGIVNFEKDLANIETTNRYGNSIKKNLHNIAKLFLKRLAADPIEFKRNFIPQKEAIKSDIIYPTKVQQHINKFGMYGCICGKIVSVDNPHYCQDIIGK
tara:strand:+ start:181 stop:630 length:450 start_codon:yes stop_codon:yes gene_type:complete